MKFKLKSVEIQGFRSFKNKVKVDFPDTGLLLLRGLSGTGKSNLVHAIAYGLDYSDKASTVAKTTNYEGEFDVAVTVETERGTVLSARGDSPRTVLYGKEILGSVPNKKSALANEFGVGASVLKALCYRPQRTFGLFLSMGDDEKKTFLSDLLGLSVIQSAYEKSAKTIAALENEIQIHTNDINVNQRVIEQSQSIMDFDPQALLDAQENLRLNKSRLMKTEESLEKATATYNREKSSMNAGVNTIVSIATKEIKELESKPVGVPMPAELVSAMDALDAAKAKFKALDTAEAIKRDTIEAQRRYLVTEIRKRGNVEAVLGIASNKYGRVFAQRTETLEQTDYCPTCKQKWGDSGHHRKLLESLDLELKAAAKELAAAENQVLLRKGLEGQLDRALYNEPPELSELEVNVDNLEEEVLVLKTRYDELSGGAYDVHREAVAELRTSWLKKVDAAKAEVVKQTEELREYLNLDTLEVEVSDQRDLVSDWSSKVQSLLALEAKHNQMLGKIKEARVKMADSSSKNIKLTVDLALENEVLRVLHKDGFVAHYFEQILQEITQETNQILQNVPNCRDITVFFGDKTLKSGKSSKNIACNVRVNGIELPYKELSGGQTSAVELAVDLAVRKVVARRTNLDLGWLVLDESFDGLGSQDKLACLEVLKVVGLESLVIVIDHTTEFQDMFTQTINVRINNGITELN